MIYKILETIKEGEVICTKVEYTFTNGVVITDVYHFQPNTLGDINRGIKNMGVTQRRKLNAEIKNLELMPLIVLNEVIEIIE